MKERIRKCWLFGDSFTANNSYHKEISFQYPLCEFLNAEMRNFGIGGMSNQEILTTAYSQMHNFSRGDYVVLGMTLSVRTVGPDFYTNTVRTYNNERIFNQPAKSFDGGCHYLPIKEEQRNTLIEYVHEFIDKPIKIWDQYWEQQFLILKRNLELIGVNVILWSWVGLHDKFTTVTQETNGEIFDNHWGFEGQKQFYKYLVNNLQEGNKILGLESIHILET